MKQYVCGCKYGEHNYAKAIRKHRTSGHTDKWHVDEMRVVIKGEVFWLWRLIDSEGEEIEVLLQKRRNAKGCYPILKESVKSNWYTA